MLGGALVEVCGEVIMGTGHSLWFVTVHRRNGDQDDYRRCFGQNTTPWHQQVEVNELKDQTERRIVSKINRGGRN